MVHMKGHKTERKSTFTCNVPELVGKTFSRLIAIIVSKCGRCLVFLFINCHDYEIELTDGDRIGGSGLIKLLR